MKWKHQRWIMVLLVLATTHCAQCIFFSDYSYIDVHKYENGQEKMPYQGRVAMVPLLKWAHSNHAMVWLAHWSEQKTGNQNLLIEPYSPEKFASFAVGLFSLLILVGLCSWYGVRYQPDLWWICPSLLISIFYITYAARAEYNLWYPYDLPHAALFTIACVALLEDRWAILLAVFLVDTPMRETSIYIVPCLLAVGYVRKVLPKALILSAIMAAVWLVVRLMINKHFQANPSETGVHYHHASQAVRNIRHWPQVTSLFGFLALPLILNRKLLTSAQNAFLLGAIPCIIFSALFGIWQETRVWSEWNGIVACLVFYAFTKYLAQGHVNEEAERIGETTERRPTFAGNRGSHDA